MAVEVALNTPLAEALSSVIQPKLVEVGWSTGGVDDSALSEYIILMLVNGKTQDQIAAELSGDLLNLGPDDPGAVDFSRWLFEQVEVLHNQLSGGQVAETAQDAEAPGMRIIGSAQNETDVSEGNQHQGDVMGQDTEMGDHMEGSAETNVPTGPKSMRKNGAGPKRMFNQISKAMDRSQDGVLHRVRPQQGTERINTHSREPPKGPRNNPMRPQRQPMGRPTGPMPNGMMPGGGPPGSQMNMSPQQHMQLLAMYEEQARMMAQILGPQQQQQMFPGMPMGGQMNPGFNNGPPQQPQQAGRSLFDRVEPKKQNGHFNKRHNQNGGTGRHQNTQDGHMETDPQQPSSSMEIETSQSKNAGPPAETICKFNLSCSKQDCPYAHQSPAAPPGTTIDVHDNCPFGAACKNKKCVARHPSPATKATHQAEQECKFFPNCTNPTCPFKHPSMPLCRNGADCTREGCKFTHVKTVCKYNPCMNPVCPFKHAEGQRRGAFNDKVWVSDQAKERNHVSERQFVDESAEEELILPSANNDERSAETAQTELVT
ncbi:MAG: hypothetical protein M4579_004853 [Chaenotheca gracillima]|nr:MAG: hypothetical protein M4579_004853 [Chaenotheca gracillima]